MTSKRLTALASCVLLIGACGRDPIERIAHLEPSGMETVLGLRVNPSGDVVAIFGVRDTPLPDYPPYGLDLVAMPGGNRFVVEGLPTGAVVGADWFPDGSALLVAVNPASPDRGLCGGSSVFVEVSSEGVVLRIVSPVTGIDASGGIAVLIDGRVLASSRPTGSCGETNEVVLIDLTTGAVMSSHVRGRSPVRAAGGVVLERDKSLAILNVESLSVEEINTGSIDVLDAAGSDGTVLVFRGYEHGTGSNAGLYSIDLAAGPSSVVFLLSTALNRPSLDSSGEILVGFLPGSPEKSQIAIMDPGAWRLLP